MKEKRLIIHECECFKPSVRLRFKEGKCSEEQIIKRHGKKFLQTLKENVVIEK